MVVEMVDLQESSFSVESSEWAETLGTSPNPCQKSFLNFWGRSEQQNKSYGQDTAKTGTKRALLLRKLFSGVKKPLSYHYCLFWVLLWLFWSLGALFRSCLDINYRRLACCLIWFRFWFQDIFWRGGSSSWGCPFFDYRVLLSFLK